MKNLVVCGILLLLAVLGPQREFPGRFDALWSLGALTLVAYLLQQLARLLRLPPLVGWLAAGLLMGVSGLQLVHSAPQQIPTLVRTLAAIWVGFQVGIHFSWPRLFDWRGLLLIGLVTLATLAITTIGIALIVEPPWWLALLLGGLGCLWGPFTMLPNPARRGVLLLGTMGTGFALLLLSAILGLLQARGMLSDQSIPLIGRLWLSLLTGALAAELLHRLDLFSARASTLAAGLFSSFFIAALFVQQLQLYSLLFGFGAGLVLVRHRIPAKRMRFLLRSLSPIAFMLFFALMGATVDLRALWPPVPGFFEIVLIQFFALVIVRGIGPAVYYPLRAPDHQSRRRLGWLLLPRGALLFELIYHPESSLLALLGDHPAHLLLQVALADILLHILLLSSLARAVQHLFPAHPPDPPVAEPAPPS